MFGDLRGLEPRAESCLPRAGDIKERRCCNVIRVIKWRASLQEITAIDHPCTGKTGKRDVFTGRTIEPLFFFFIHV